MTEYAWYILSDGREVYRRVEQYCEPKRSDLPTPMFIRDDMPETEHPCTGQAYNSKSSFRAVTKAHGCVEIGNDSSRFNVPDRKAPDRQGIRNSLQKAAAQAKA